MPPASFAREYAGDILMKAEALASSLTLELARTRRISWPAYVRSQVLEVLDASNQLTFESQLLACVISMLAYYHVLGLLDVDD
jgi:hypothetical protein